MRMLPFAAFALVAGAALLAEAPDALAGSGKKHRIHRGGDHYDEVMSNYIRRCADLTRQFDRALAERPETPQTGQAVRRYQQGVAHCEGGPRMQGVDELNDAIRLLGAIPRVNL